jgi:hypothetical protein
MFNKQKNMQFLNKISSDIDLKTQNEQTCDISNQSYQKLIRSLYLSF